MDTVLLSFVVVGFLAIVLLLEGGYLLWDSNRSAEAKRIQGRLRVLSAGDRLSADSEFVKRDMLNQLPRAYRVALGMRRLKALDRMLLQSGLQRTVPAFLAMSLAAAAAGFVLWLMLPLPWWTAPVVVLGVASFPFLHVLFARGRRLRALEAQLPGVLDLMSRALRAGHAFPSAVQMVGEEGPEPSAGEFRLTFDESNYGVPMQDALMNLAARVPVTDLRFFVIAVAIQRETGGNLTELLDKIASLIRARFKLLGTIRVLSSEGRLSAWILSLLPFVMMIIINLINPKFMSLLWTDRAGVVALYISGTLMLAGILWMWRIVKVRV